MLAIEGMTAAEQWRHSVLEHLIELKFVGQWEGAI